MGNQPKTNYFLATWSGNRRKGHTLGGNLTYQHLQYLEKLEHQLSQITVGWPHNPSEPKSYVKWMKALHGTTIGGAKVVVERVKNEGYSYGQYSKMFDRHSNFDRYIFTEDDYVPVQHGFDSKLINMFDEYYVENNCGYLCGLVKPVHFRKIPKDKTYLAHNPLHAAIAWGITNKTVLQKLVNERGRIPFTGMGTRGLHPQIAFSLAFDHIDYILQDVLEDYCSPYLQGVSNIEYYGDSENPAIIAPIQYAILNRLFDVVPKTPFERRSLC